MWEAEHIASIKPVQVISLDEEEDDVDMDDQDEVQEDLFPQIPYVETSGAQAATRADAYRRAWSGCESSIQAVLGGLYASTIRQIVDFVASVDTNAKFARRAIPTGLILGANHTLSATLTSALQRSFSKARQEESEPGPSTRTTSTHALLARISSRDCPNKRTALKSLIQAIISSAAVEDDEVEVQRRTGGRKPSLLAADDIHVLLAWYASKFGQLDAARRPRIAIYFEDFEAFDSNVLSDLLYIISTQCKHLPFVLLFAIATSANAIHSLLPRATSELLRVVPFTVTQSTETFHALMQEVFINRSQPLSPGQKMFNLLRDTFLDYNQSIDAVVSKLQYMYMVHFFNNPATSLCLQPEDDEDIDETLPATHLAPYLRGLPSFQRFVEEAADSRSSASSLRSLLTDDVKLVQSVKGSRSAKTLYKRKVREAWLLYEVLQDTWTEGRASQETLLTDYYRGKLVERACKTCLALKRSRDERCLAFLQAAAGSLADNENIPCDLDSFLTDLNDLMQNGQRQTGRNNFVNGNELGGLPQTEGDKAYTKLVNKLADTLERYFRDAFRPYTSLTFHEIWYSDEHRLIRSTFHPPILSHLQASLASPTSRIPKHLLEPAFTTSAEEDHPFIQAEDIDLCETHKLVVDAGKLVNLADWCGAFELSAKERRGDREAENLRPANKKRKGDEEVLRTPQKKEKGKGKTRQRDPSMHIDGEEEEDGEAEGVGGGADSRTRQVEARFLNGVADLAFLGFIQPSKRKAEHVSRIVF